MPTTYLNFPCEHRKSTCSVCGMNFCSKENRCKQYYDKYNLKKRMCRRCMRQNSERSVRTDTEVDDG